MEEQSMIEKVAMAIFDEMEISDGLDLPVAQRYALAAIKAIRKPTAEMLAPEDVHWDYSCHVCGGLNDGYTKMLAAALKEQEKV